MNYSDGFIKFNLPSPCEKGQEFVFVRSNSILSVLPKFAGGESVSQIYLLNGKHIIVQGDQDDVMDAIYHAEKEL